MAFLAAAVAVLAMITLVNVLLTVGVIRRLREHASRLELIDGPAGLVLRSGPGTAVGEFATVTTEGEPVSLAGLGSDTVVAVLSSECAPCHELLPKFVDYAATLPGGRDRVLAVALGTEADTRELVVALGPVARVVVEDEHGAIVNAFGVRAYPSVFVIDGTGTIIASGGDIDTLRSAPKSVLTAAA
jgi:hypothetical protein